MRRTGRGMLQGAIALALAVAGVAGPTVGSVAAAGTGGGHHARADRPAPSGHWATAGPDTVVGAGSLDASLIAGRPTAAGGRLAADATAPQPLSAPIDVIDGPEGFMVIVGVVRNHGAYRLRTIDTGTSSAALDDVDAVLDGAATDLTSLTGWSFSRGTRRTIGGDPALIGPDTAGEIWVTVATSSPCGTLDDQLIGCGGPFAVADPVAPDAGMVWISPAVLVDPDLLGGTVRHELGHALGLAHDPRPYGGQLQLMFPSAEGGLVDYRSGDANGLAYLAPTCPSPFVDVAPTHALCDAVRLGSDHGLVAGYDDGTFAPSRSVTRAQAASLLARADRNFAGYGTPPTPRFTDVAPSSPHSRAVEWLADHGVIGGYPDGTFRPNEPITRQAMARYLHRFLVAVGEDVPPEVFADATSTGRCGFADLPASSPYCTDVMWVWWNGVATGTTASTFSPAQPVARAAAAAFVVRAVVAERVITG